MTGRILPQYITGTTNGRRNRQKMVTMNLSFMTKWLFCKRTSVRTSVQTCRCLQSPPLASHKQKMASTNLTKVWLLIKCRSAHAVGCVVFVNVCTLSKVHLVQKLVSVKQRKGKHSCLRSSIT